VESDFGGGGFLGGGVSFAERLESFVRLEERWTLKWPMKAFLKKSLL